MQSIEDELQIIYNELRKPNKQNRYKAAVSLSALYAKKLVEADKIFTLINRLFISQQITDKTAALIALEQLTKQITEHLEYTFVSKFQGVLFKQFQIVHDQKFCEKNVEVFRKLLRLGGNRIDNAVQQEVIVVIEWLKSNKEQRKYPSLLLLTTLLSQAPYCTFKRLFQSQRLQLGFISSALQNKKQNIRMAGIRLFEESVKQISQRELQFQKSILGAFYKDVKKGMSNHKQNHKIHGIVQQLKLLLSYSQLQFFKQKDETIREIFEYIKKIKQTRGQL